MSEIVEFLLARLAEDEQSAQSATPGPWDLNMIQPDMGGNHQYGLRSATTAGPIGAVSAGAFRMRGADARHIARHDPARVLAEVEAKRRIVALVQDAQERYDQERTSGYGDGSDLEWLTKLEALEPILNLLALPYADHADYRGLGL